MAPAHRAAGQALVFVALILPVLLALALTCVEVAARYQELAAVEDALQQATRSAVQTFDYAAFAGNAPRGRETQATTVTGCADLAPTSARAIACAVFLINLSDVGGMAETAAETAARVQWSFLPQGGACAFPNRRPSITFSTPAVCATLRPQMVGLLGWGIWSPQLDAADTLDSIGQ